MAKPYFLVAYGHTMRISDRCDFPFEAMQYCFGITDEKRMTCERREGKSWAYISQKQKRAIIIALAQKHYDRTGSVLSGCAGEIKMKKEKKHEPDVPSREQPDGKHEHPGWTEFDGPSTEHGVFTEEAHGQVHEAECGRGEGVESDSGGG